MKSIATAFGIIVLLILAGLVYVYSGSYDVAASQPHSGPVHWLLQTTMEHSVEAHADGIRVPPLSDPSLIQIGAHHYREMCQGCHAAPGVSRSEMGRGLNPPAPELTKTADDWSASQLFWIIKHGIKMTGMPAWGETHSDDKLWAIVAFTRRLPQLSPDQYAQMTSGPAGADEADEPHAANHS
jgi:mono/diheme cytochrome c family protein